jgi:hypothetical protein
LQARLSDAEWEFCFLSDEQRTDLFPASGLWPCGNAQRPEPDICSLRHSVALSLPFPGGAGDLVYEVAPVPAILELPKVEVCLPDGETRSISFRHNFRARKNLYLAEKNSRRVKIAQAALSGAVLVRITFTRPLQIIFL